MCVCVCVCVCVCACLQFILYICRLFYVLFNFILFCKLMSVSAKGLDILLLMRIRVF